MAKANKIVIIDEIIKQIEKGQDRGNLLSSFGKKWQLSNRTFDRYWKTAQQRYSERQQERQRKLEDDKTLKELEARKEALMSSIEKKELLVKQIKRIEKLIASGKTPDYIRKPTKFLNPRVHRNLTATEIASLSETCQRLTAELNKMEGDYAPAKIEQKTIIIEDIDYSKLSESALNEILSAKR